jgi:MFS family permease
VRLPLHKRSFKLLVYLFSACDGLVFIYPVYVLMFRDLGFTDAELSYLLALWPLTSAILALPSGVWADRYSKKTLLVCGQLMRIVGFCIWLLFPTFVGCAIGLALWGSQGAIYFATFRVFLFEEMKARGEGRSYTKFFGRTNAIRWATTVVGYVLGPIMAAFGYPQVILATICSLLVALIAFFCIEERSYAPAPESPTTSFGSLRNGIDALRADSWLTMVLVGGGVFFGLGGVDEYWSLFATETGVERAYVGVYIGVVLGARLLGELAAHRLETMGARPVVATGVLAGLALAGAGLVFKAWISCAAVAIFSFFFQAVVTALNGVLQYRVCSNVRGTITSMQVLASNAVGIVLYIGIGRVAEFAGYGWGFAAVGAAFIIVSIVFAIFL